MANIGRLTRARGAAPWLTPVTLVRVVIVLSVLVVWQVMAVSGWFYGDVVPSLRIVTVALVKLLTSSDFYWNLWATIEGLSTTRRVLLNVGRSFKLTPAQQFWKIYFPSALPTIFVGIRLGLIFALINVVGVEFLINFGGLGHLINELAERYDLAGTYAAICFVVLVSIVFFMATERAERWLTSAA